MKNNFNDIIYIGKAKNLFNRVKSYFYKSRNPLPKVTKLRREVKHIEFRTTNTELEALLLESKLIKHYLPKYNSQLRKYKRYSFIKISIKNKYPRLYASRNFSDDDNYYFGPFSNFDTLIENLKSFLQSINTNTIRSFSEAFNRKSLTFFKSL